MPPLLFSSNPNSGVRATPEVSLIFCNRYRKSLFKSLSISLMDVTSALTILIFHGSAAALRQYRVWHRLETQQQHLCKSAHTCLQQLLLLCFSTHKSPFWFTCTSAVLPFKYGCSSSAVVTGGLVFYSQCLGYNPTSVQHASS